MNLTKAQRRALELSARFGPLRCSGRRELPAFGFQVWHAGFTARFDVVQRLVAKGLMKRSVKRYKGDFLVQYSLTRKGRELSKKRQWNPVFIWGLPDDLERKLQKEGFRFVGDWRRKQTL